MLIRVRSEGGDIGLAFIVAALEARRVEARRVGRDVAAEQIERHAVVEVQILLHRLQIDDAERADVIGIVHLVLGHQLGGALHDAADAGLADEHVVRFLGEHEAARARERIETGFGERGELELAVTVGEEREHVKRQPVGRRLVERAEDARVVDVARTAFEQRFGFLAAITSEVAVQQIHHRPEMTAFLDVHLKNIPQIVE